MDIIKAIAVALVLAAAPAHAAKPSADVPVEMGMRVEGTLAIGDDGRITALEIDKQDLLPEAVATLVRDTVKNWEFEPNVRDGAPVPMDARMTVRVVAQPGANDTFNVRLISAHFDGARKDASGREIKSRVRTPPPRYPADVFRVGGQGTVYLALKVDREGRVVDQVAEQVNLRSTGTAAQMDLIRSRLSRASLDAARKWRFPLSAEDASLEAPFRTYRVPVSFAINTAMPDDLAQWRAYIPGPRNAIPWSTRPESAGFSPDLLTDGSATLAGDPTAPRLRTPLGS